MKALCHIAGPSRGGWGFPGQLRLCTIAATQGSQASCHATLHCWARLEWLLLHIAHQFLAYQKDPKPQCGKQSQSCTVLGLLATSQGTVQGSQKVCVGMCGIGSWEELKGEGEPYLRTGMCNYFFPRGHLGNWDCKSVSSNKKLK